ncbi:thioredoxin-disulfide reductase [Buchnera aphidicola (Ceratoglyphina bambusae)]|uniref:thioredoxin-disulfide reductase n=1 Tax=Buchnera aphidicola TaxID=9 RepID=UPI0031B8AF59
MKKKVKSNLIILGSGPAGYTASIYASRANLFPILITGEEIGGQLYNTEKIENWPSEYNSLSGKKLMKNFYKHSIKFGTKIYEEKIIKVIFKNFNIKLLSENFIFNTKALIIATGSVPKKLGIKSEKQFEGKGISSCAICDGYFYKNKKIAIVGGGNTAISEVLYLSKIVKKIYLIHRSDKWKAEKILLKRLFKKTKSYNIKIYKNYIIKKIYGNNIVSHIKIQSTKTKKNKKIFISCLFIAIGHIPKTELFENKLDIDNGYIKINSGRHGNFTSTNIPGIFAAGDVVDHVYKQAITASAFGCMAAIDAERYLEQFKNKKNR